MATTCVGCGQFGHANPMDERCPLNKMMASQRDGSLLNALQYTQYLLKAQAMQQMAQNQQNAEAVQRQQQLNMIHQQQQNMMMAQPQMQYAQPGMMQQPIFVQQGPAMGPYGAPGMPDGMSMQMLQQNAMMNPMMFAGNAYDLASAQQKQQQLLANKIPAQLQQPIPGMGFPPQGQMRQFVNQQQWSQAAAAAAASANAAAQQAAASQASAPASKAKKPKNTQPKNVQAKAPKRSASTVSLPKQPVKRTSSSDGASEPSQQKKQKKVRTPKVVETVHLSRDLRNAMLDVRSKKTSRYHKTKLIARLVAELAEVHKEIEVREREQLTSGQNYKRMVVRRDKIKTKIESLEVELQKISEDLAMLRAKEEFIKQKENLHIEPSKDDDGSEIIEDTASEKALFARRNSSVSESSEGNHDSELSETEDKVVADAEKEADNEEEKDTKSVSDDENKSEPEIPLKNNFQTTHEEAPKEAVAAV